MKNRTLLTGLLTIVLVGLSGGIFLNLGSETDIVDATVSDLKLNSGNYEATLVKVDAKIVNWTEKTFFVTVTDNNGLVDESSFTRKYLVIQDLNTNDMLYVKPVKDIPADFISEGEVISLTGYLKDSLYYRNVKLQEYELDGLFFVISIKNSSNEVLEIDTIPNKMKFNGFRSQIKNNLKDFKVEVLEWDKVNYNVTIISDDFYRSRIISIDILKVIDTNTQEVFFVKIGNRQMENRVPTDFLSVGEQITVKGVQLDINISKLTERPIYSFLDDVDGIILGISIKNSSGEVYQPFRMRQNRPGSHS